MIDASECTGPDRRFIEESFPVKEVSAISAKEKNIRHGHISTLHIWWARRPLAASRATAYAALVPAADDIEEWQQQRNSVVELSKWENSRNQPFLDTARRAILEAHAKRLSAERGESITMGDIEAGRAPRPRVLDPFAGGGAIPLEALRLGCETYASDYNPVATLILKAMLQYPHRYGRPVDGSSSGASRDIEKQLPGLETTRTLNPLLEAVKRWGDWVLAEACKELEPFYPPDPDGSTPVGYIWARTLPCQNPNCGVEIPLMRQFWLAKKPRKKIALYPVSTDGKLGFRIIGTGYDPWPASFDPKAGTVSNATVTCPACAAVTDAKTVRRLFRQGDAGQRLVAVVLASSKRRGKFYRLAVEKDDRVFCSAKKVLQEKQETLMANWGISPVPDEPISRRRPSPNARGASGLTRYEMTSWGDLFNSRQRLALITFSEKVREAYKQMLCEGIEAGYARAIATYLGLGIDELSRFTSVLNPWKVDAEAIVHAFGRQALPMLWDYNENNPLGTHGGTWRTRLAEMMTVIENICEVDSNPATVTQASATQLAHPDGFFDAILTDPPYYDNVPYSHLADFFYVWLKRSIGYLYPDLFSTPLTPKAGEIVAYTLPEGGFEAGTRFFEEGLKQAFQEIHRLLKRGGTAVIVYAHKSAAGWETVINALLDSGLVVSGSWPLHTESKSRLTARETASLASSIYIVARKLTRRSVGFYNEVREELRQHLDRKLHRLWEEGIGGADFFIAAIGSAIEIFGKYKQVMDYEGNEVRADRLLEDVRIIATDYAVRQILRDGFAGEVSDLTRLYVLWRWNYGEVRVPFDEARKLAQSCGVDLTHEWGRRNSYIQKQREFVRLLGPNKRKLEGLEDSRELIDVLHRILLLWEKGQRREMVDALASSGYGQSEAFYRVAQAISETLPNTSKEKKLLDGFLAGRERVREEVGRTAQQRTLWNPGEPL